MGGDETGFEKKTEVSSLAECQQKEVALGSLFFQERSGQFVNGRKVDDECVWLPFDAPEVEAIFAAG